MFRYHVYNKFGYYIGDINHDGLDFFKALQKAKKLFIAADVVELANVNGPEPVLYRKRNDIISSFLPPYIPIKKKEKKMDKIEEI